jgi:hypothetical protein
MEHGGIRCFVTLDVKLYIRRVWSCIRKEKDKRKNRSGRKECKKKLKKKAGTPSVKKRIRHKETKEGRKEIL